MLSRIFHHTVLNIFCVTCNEKFSLKIITCLIYIFMQTNTHLSMFWGKMPCSNVIGHVTRHPFMLSNPHIWKSDALDEICGCRVCFKWVSVTLYKNKYIIPWFQNGIKCLCRNLFEMLIKLFKGIVTLVISFVNFCLSSFFFHDHTLQVNFLWIIINMLLGTWLAWYKFVCFFLKFQYIELNFAVFFFFFSHILGIQTILLMHHRSGLNFSLMVHS